MKDPTDRRSQTTEGWKQLLGPRSEWFFCSWLPCTVKMIGDERSDFLRKQNHAQDHRYGGPQQNTANHSSPYCTLFSPMLLPKSERDQNNRHSQKPRTQSREESTRSTGP